ncbi:hypothetical protein SGPA1_80034 [Streptomyces misionensis JCM 4497]
MSLGICFQWVPGAKDPVCRQVPNHAGPCGPAPDLNQLCGRGCPAGECVCPLPGEPGINPACGHTRTEQCQECMCCRVCDGCREP